jgi:hypothetical protein
MHNASSLGFWNKARIPYYPPPSVKRQDHISSTFKGPHSFKFTIIHLACFSCSCLIFICDYHYTLPEGLSNTATFPDRHGYLKEQSSKNLIPFSYMCVCVCVCGGIDLNMSRVWFNGSTRSIRDNVKVF